MGLFVMLRQFSIFQKFNFIFCVARLRLLSSKDVEFKLVVFPLVGLQVNFSFFPLKGVTCRYFLFLINTFIFEDPDSLSKNNSCQHVQNTITFPASSFA